MKKKKNQQKINKTKSDNTKHFENKKILGKSLIIIIMLAIIKEGVNHSFLFSNFLEGREEMINKK